MGCAAHALPQQWGSTEELLILPSPYSVLTLWAGKRGLGKMTPGAAMAGKYRTSPSQRVHAA